MSGRSSAFDTCVTLRQTQGERRREQRTFSKRHSGLSPNTYPWSMYDRREAGAWTEPV